MDDGEFHRVYGPRRESINRKNLGHDFDAFLTRLNTTDAEVGHSVDLLETAATLLQNVIGQQTSEWDSAARSFFDAYTGSIPNAITPMKPTYPTAESTDASLGSL